MLMAIAWASWNAYKIKVVHLVTESRGTSYLLPLTSYFCLTKFAQRGEPPQRNFALPLTSYLLPLTYSSD